MENMTTAAEERQLKDWTAETSRRLALYKGAVEAYDQAICQIAVVNVQNEENLSELYLAAVLPYLEKIHACDKAIPEPKSQLERSLADRGLLYDHTPPSYAEATSSRRSRADNVQGEYLRLTLQEAASRKKWHCSRNDWESGLRRSMEHDDDKKYAQKEWSEVVVPCISHCLDVPYYHLRLEDEIDGSKVEAWRTFEWQNRGDLSFSSGQKIDVVAAVDRKWLVGRYIIITGSIQVVKVGIFPRNHIGRIGFCGRYLMDRCVPERWETNAADKKIVREVPAPPPIVCSHCSRSGSESAPLASHSVAEEPRELLMLRVMIVISIFLACLLGLALVELHEARSM